MKTSILMETVACVAGFCGICMLIYLCTFRTYLKGWKGTIAQRPPLTQKNPCVAASHVPIATFAINVEQNDRMTIGTAGLNYGIKVKPMAIVEANDERLRMSSTEHLMVM